MKILIEICGIGNGHLNRQSSVIKLLTSKGKEFFEDIKIII